MLSSSSAALCARHRCGCQAAEASSAEFNLQQQQLVMSVSLHVASWTSQAEDTFEEELKYGNSELSHYGTIRRSWRMAIIVSHYEIVLLSNQSKRAADNFDIPQELNIFKVQKRSSISAEFLNLFSPHQPQLSTFFYRFTWAAIWAVLFWTCRQCNKLNYAQFGLSIWICLLALPKF